MVTFLTTRDVQDLINVDRSTVYRMAEDGRLPGIKVGRQWRFPAGRIAEQLGLPTTPDGHVGTSPGDAASGGAARNDSGLSDLLGPDSLRSIVELAGALFGLMAVATDMDGHPVTPVVNKCGFYNAFDEHPGADEACLVGWRRLAEQPHVAARFVPTHLGFLCARTFVWVDRRPVGMIVVGGMTPEVWPPERAFLEEIAEQVGIGPERLFDTVDQTFDIDSRTKQWILQQLPQFGDLVSQLATARHRLLTTSHPTHERNAS